MFKNGGDMAMGAKKRKPSTFWKLMNFGPHILTLLESTRAELQDAINFWTKV